MFMVAQILMATLVSANPIDWLHGQLHEQHRYQAEWEVRGVWSTGEKIPKDTLYLRSTLAISRDLNAWKRSLSERRIAYRRGKLQSRESGDIYLANGTTLYVAFTDGRTTLHEPVSFETNYRNGFLPPTPNDVTPFVLGFLPLSFRPLSEPFASPTNYTHRTEGSREYFTARTAYGIVTLGFDAADGHCLSDIKVAAGPDDFNCFDHKLKEAPADEGGPMEYVRSIHRVTAFRKIANNYFPAEWELRRKSKPLGGEEVSYTNYGRLTKLVLDPLFDSREFDPSAFIPNGTRMQVEGKETVAHEWRNGEIVKSVNSNLAESAYHFQQPTRSGAWIWIGPAALAVVAFAYFARRKVIVR